MKSERQLFRWLDHFVKLAAHMPRWMAVGLHKRSVAGKFGFGALAWLAGNAAGAVYAGLLNDYK